MPALVVEEFADRRGNLLDMGFQGKVTGIEEADLGVGNVPPEGLGARWQEERVVLAPNRQEPRLARAEVRLEGWVERDVALVVAEQMAPWANYSAFGSVAISLWLRNEVEQAGTVRRPAISVCARCQLSNRSLS